MDKFSLKFFSIGFLAAGISLSGCKKDDDIKQFLSIAGNFVGKEKCPTVPGSPYTISIFNQADVTNGKAFISNLYGIGETYEALVDGNKITVPKTAYQYTVGTGAAAVTYRGNISATGTVDGNILTISYILDGDDPEQCSFMGDREFRGPTHQGPN
jgi:hypothetical protein